MKKEVLKDNVLKLSEQLMEINNNKSFKNFKIPPDIKRSIKLYLRRINIWI